MYKILVVVSLAYFVMIFRSWKSALINDMLSCTNWYDGALSDLSLIFEYNAKKFFKSYKLINYTLLLTTDNYRIIHLLINSNLD